MRKKLAAAVRAIVGGFLWLVVLVPILGVSAYSLYAIGRYLGVPPAIAIAFSTCFDGVALFAARKSVDYAQAGLSGSFPKAVVRLFALTAAFLQTLHVRINGEPKAAAILWAALPIGAMLVYEMHIRWERRKALARSGQIYPSPLPQFGLMTWFLFPLSTMSALRTITQARRAALVTAANVVVADFQRQSARVKNTREPVALEPAETAEEATVEIYDAKVAEPEVMREHRARHAARPRPQAASGAHAPKAAMRAWAKSQPQYASRVGDHGRIHQDIQDAYYEANPDTRSGLCFLWCSGTSTRTSASRRGRYSPLSTGSISSSRAITLLTGTAASYSGTTGTTRAGYTISSTASIPGSTSARSTVTATSAT
jgi:hypothetical protein